MSDNTNSAHGFTEGSEFKTETKEMEGERKFDLVKKTLNALYVQVPEEVVTDVICNILPYVVELRSELQKAKELNGELVKGLNNILENCDHHPRVEELLEELIKKSES